MPAHIKELPGSYTLWASQTATVPVVSITTADPDPAQAIELRSITLQKLARSAVEYGIAQPGESIPIETSDLQTPRQTVTAPERFTHEAKPLQ